MSLSSEDDDVEVGDYDQNFEQQRIEEDLKRDFPNKPENTKPTLPFHVLYKDLFEPLIANQNRKQSNRPTGRKAGPHSISSNPREVRRGIIERFISRWRREVGQDIYPAMRLIIPEKDRDRPMYGLKEKALAKYLVRLMKIDKNSEDGFSLLHWKLPGQNAATRSAGDFAARCYDVLCKRAHRIEPGNMTIEEVNKQLDLLAHKSKEEDQIPIMEVFYKNMNADEMTWLIRIIIRSMKIGASERTILHVWHEDAEALFNVSSSLRRVCWELYDTKIRLETDERDVKLGECFRPQLAHQPNMSFAKMVAGMQPTENDSEFWIEEKLDGERMQLHVSADPQKPGDMTFRFWSRHAKDYSYLYGTSFGTEDAALTQYIRGCFKQGVENAILDGEMIAWDVRQDAIVPFGTLKPVAIAQKTNSELDQRPFYRIFDILLLNGQVLTRYTLRDRRRALEATVNNIHRRFEILPYSIGTSADDVENSLRDVVARASEGLVLKNPRSAYILDARLHDWCKVKPEYMTEFGESLDCLIIGGYYGSGHRGGRLSSFLCGLRKDERGKKTRKFLSFFKVGGGMTADDFAKLHHNTDGKWHKYDASNPPSDYIVLGGADRQLERPDMWIKPEDSIVVEVKAASVNLSSDYAYKSTLRFPRFTRFRLDKNWETVLSVEEFENIQGQAEHKAEVNREDAKKMQINKRRQKTQSASRKKQILIAGYDGRDTREAMTDSVKSDVFRGLTFYIMTESTIPEKKSKVELEQMVKDNGGMIVQNTEIKQKNPDSPKMEIVCIAERRTVKVASLEKRGRKEIIRPIWLFDCLKQGKIDFAKGKTEMVLPLEIDRHLFFAAEEGKAACEGNVDRFGDSYARDTTKEELRDLMDGMGKLNVNYGKIEKQDLLDPGHCRGWMFAGLTLWFDDANSESDRTPSPSPDSLRVSSAEITARFAGARLVDTLDDETITHVVLKGDSDKKRIRKETSKRKRLPRIVSLDWVEQCWEEHTRIDEERFAVV